ncbi:MAG: hypothetical protein JNN15_16370 [Blastocatellia bacterium]|nr:hypothetical protein [Blastocatellia bacterium]
MVSSIGGNNFLSNINNVVRTASQTINTANQVLQLANAFVDFANNASNFMQNASKAASGNPLPEGMDVAKLFGTGNAFEAENDKQKEAAKAAALGGGPKSLGALLAIVGSLLVKSIESTMANLQKAAQQLDAATNSKGPTAALNQQIQEMTFNLQQIQQTLNRVNETVTNLSRSQSDAQKSTAQNLSV